MDINIQSITTPNRGKEQPLRDWTDKRYTIFDSGVIEAGERARPIDVKIPRCERLILLTTRLNEAITQAIWGRPRLHVR